MNSEFQEFLDEIMGKKAKGKEPFYNHKYLVYKSMKALVENTIWDFVDDKVKFENRDMFRQVVSLTILGMMHLAEVTDEQRKEHEKLMAKLEESVSQNGADL